MDITTSTYVRGAMEPQLRYVALRLANADIEEAASGAGLKSIAAATELERLFQGNLERKLRVQLNLSKNPRGVDALSRRLHLAEAAVLARRLLALSPAEVDRLAETLRPDPTRRRRNKARSTRPLPVIELIAQLRVLAGTLPLELALLVQVRDGYYRQEDIARIQALGARIVVGKPVRRLGDKPGVCVVPAENTSNRVEHGRLTAYVRCMLASAQLIHRLSEGSRE